MGRANKYNNTKTVIDGISFDSRKEGQRYQDLKLMRSAGMITDLQLQPEFELQPSFKVGKKTERKIVYKADFMYKPANSDRYVVEDVKSEATVEDKVFCLKRKMFIYKYPEYDFRVFI